MATIMQQYKETQSLIGELEAKLNKLKDNPDLNKEIELEQKLEDLMKEYGKSKEDIIAILDPKVASQVKNVSRRQRRTKKYVNPHTQEVCETKGGNNKQLKAWKEKYGPDEVESWVEFN